MRLILTICLSLLGSPVTAAAQPATPPPAHGGPVLGIAEAMAHMVDGDWIGALEAGQRAGPIGRDVIEWHRLRSGLGTFDEALKFLNRRPDWPGLAFLRRQNEAVLPLEVTTHSTAMDVVGFFDGAEPTTARGAVALVEAHQILGDEANAAGHAALAWIGLPMNAAAEARLLLLFPDLLASLNPARLDRMLWQGATSAAIRAIDRVEPDRATLARARLALRADDNVDAAVASVPKQFANHAGLAYDRFRWRLNKGRREDAADLMLAQSTSPLALGQPERWARARRDLARRAMWAEDHQRAYDIAASHQLEEGSNFADLEWLSGYLALRFLDEPDLAVSHFKRFRARVATPISLGRAGYWLGRAHEAAGNSDLADMAYRFGAQYQTSFYGLLAAEAAGLPLSAELAGREAAPNLEDTSFRDSTVLEAALLLQAAGERDLAERFMTHLAESLTAPEIATLGDLATTLGEPHIALMIGKRAAQYGITVPRAYYPVVELGIDPLPVSGALALAIARRESEFDPGVSSGVGARGLMQLMPATAKEVAGQLDLPYSPRRLFSDPSYNARLGTAYLAGLERRFGKNPILVAAGYNAGPSRPLRWMNERGDPRDADVDVIDWIEHIPFDETRNYVMRVAESLPVYRARLSGQVEPFSFTAELKGR